MVYERDCNFDIAWMMSGAGFAGEIDVDKFVPFSHKNLG